MQTPLLEPHLLLVGEVRGHCGEGDRQVLDVHVTEQLQDPPEDALATDGTEVAETEVQQPQHIQIIQP